jgi:hypothetical protein
MTGGRRVVDRTQIPDAGTRALIRELSSLRSDVDGLKASLRSVQLGNSSIENGALTVNDADGNTRAVIGLQPDGTFTTTSVNNPNPPPIPKAPTAASTKAGIQVTSQGPTVGSWPQDFSHLNVYCQPNDLSSAAVLAGTITPEPGVLPIAPLAYIPYRVWLTSVNHSGTESAPSGYVTATPAMVVGQDVLNGIITDLKLADSAVTQAKIATAAVGTGQIQGNAVTLGQLANGSVDATKLLDGAVVSGKIAASAVGTNELAANSVVAGKVAASSITTTEIAALTIQAGDLAADSVSAGKIAANAVTAREILALAVTADKIAANSINAGHITAGAVTADKLAATIVLGGTVIAGAQGGARVQLGSFGIEAFRTNGTTKTLDFDNATGNLLIAGQYRSGDSGERVIINTDGTQQFTNSSGGTSGKIANNGNDLLLSGTPGTSSRTGVLNVNSSGAGITYRNPANTTLLGEVNVQSGAVANNAAIVYVHADQRVAAANGTQRMQVSTVDTGGDEIPSSIVNIVAVSGNGGVLCPVENTGIVFSSGTVLATTGNGAAFGPMKATQFILSSSETMKENIGEVTLPDGRTSWDLIEGAPAQNWDYISERPDPLARPTDPAGNIVQKRIRNPALSDDEFEELLDYDPRKWVNVRSAFSEAALAQRSGRRRHKFPLAEDLHALCPDMIDGDPSDPANLGADVRDAVGILWDATDMLIKRNRILETALTQRLPLLNLPGRPQKGDVVAGIGAIVAGRTRRDIDAATGQIRDRIRTAIGR